MDQLKRLRAEKGLSQAKLAALADIDPSTVNQIERGAREASPATLRKLAQALDVSLYELIEGEPRPLEQPRLPEPSEAERRGESHVYRLEDETALAVLFRGLARRARHIVERSRREGPSAELGEDAAALHGEANALYRLRGRRDILGTGSEKLADAVDAYEEVEGTIQAMLRQDVEATDEERDTARRFRHGADDASRHGEADAS
jgi:transcriptional regulator with XRE-family HTH domain